MYLRKWLGGNALTGVVFEDVAKMFLLTLGKVFLFLLRSFTIVSIVRMVEFLLLTNKYLIDNDSSEHHYGFTSNDISFPLSF